MALQDILQKILDEAATEVKNIEVTTTDEKKLLKSEADEQTADLLEKLADKKGVPYQTLINLYLKDCMEVGREPNIEWKKLG